MGMRRLTALVVACCMFMVMLPLPAVNAHVNLEENLLVNGDFSDGITGWTKKSTADTMEVLEEDGEFYLSYPNNQGGYRYAYQMLSVETGETYRFSGYMKDEYSAELKRYVLFSRERGSTYETVHFPNGWTTNQWNEFYCDVIAEGDTLYAGAGLPAGYTNGGNMNLKNLKVQKVTEPMPNTEPYISGCDTITANGAVYLYSLENDLADSWKFTTGRDFPEDKLELTTDEENGTLTAVLTQDASDADVQNCEITVEAVNGSGVVASKVVKFAEADDLRPKFNLVSDSFSAWDSHFGTELVTVAEGVVTVSNRKTLGDTADQVVTVQGGVTYLVSAEIEAAEAAEGNQFILTNTRADADDGLSDLGVTPVSGKQGDTKLTGEFVAPGSGAYHILLGLRELGGAPTDTVKMKNVELYPVHAITSVAFVNASFGLINAAASFSLTDCVKIVDETGCEQTAEDVVFSIDGMPPAGISIRGSLLYVSADTPAGEVRVNAVVNGNGMRFTGSGTITLEAYLDDEQKLAEAEQALHVFLLTQENPDVITKDLTLPETVGSHGAVVEWASTDASVISDEGVVYAGETEQSVSMIATIRVSGETATKQFPFTVACTNELIRNGNYAGDLGDGEGRWRWYSAPAEYSKKTDPEMGWDYYEVRNRPYQSTRLVYNYTPETTGTYILKGYIRSNEDTSGLKLMWMYKNTSAMDSLIHDEAAAASETGQWTEIVTTVHVTEGIPICIGFIEAYSQNASTVKNVDLGPISMRPAAAPATVTVVGSSFLRVPQTGEISVPYSASALNPLGETLESQMDWSLYTLDGSRQTAKDSVYVDTEGNLHVKPETEIGARYWLFAKAAAGKYTASNDAFEITMEAFMDEGAVLDSLIAEKLQFRDLTEYDKEEQRFGWDTADDLKNDMTTLPLTISGEMDGVSYTVQIAWTSSDPNVIEITDNGDGTATAAVTPSLTDDAKVTLTAELKTGVVEKTHSIVLTVPKYDNYVKNGGFEYWQQSDAWTGAAFADGEGVAHETSANASAASTAGYAASFTQGIDRLQAGHYYYVDAALRGQGTGSIALAGMRKTVSLQPSGWQHVAAWFGFDDSKDATLTLSGDTGAIYVDDILVRDITSELNAANAAVNAAVTSKTTAAKEAALAAVQALGNVTSTVYFDKYTQLYQKAADIDTTKSNGGTSGSGGGDGSVKRKVSITDGNLPVIPSTEPNDGFSDTSSHWASNDIVFLKNLGVLNGYADGSFRPDSNISRAEFATMVVRAAQWDLETYQGEYFDVAENDWYASIVATMLSCGVMSGSDGSFRPNDLITREEAVVTIVRACSVLGASVAAEDSEIAFADADEISAWAVSSIQTAYAAGLAAGVDDTHFAPKAETTRAAAAALIRRMYDRWNNNQ